MIDFVKAHGIGNDFVLIPDLEDRLDVSAEAVRKLCDRRFGIGGDGIIRLAPGQNASYFMDYRNSDGSISEMCGNAVRTVGKWLGDRGHAGDSVDVETRAGIKTLALQRDGAGNVEIVVADMGPPAFDGDITEEIEIGGQQFTISSVSMGNPHAVIFVDDVDAVPLELVGPLIQSHGERFPDGVNVELAAVQPDGVIRERTYERGSGETLACGTAACAVAVAAQRRGLGGEIVQMQLRGGPLTLEWQPGGSVFMTGPAEESFHGSFDPTLYGIALRA